MSSWRAALIFVSLAFADSLCTADTRAEPPVRPSSRLFTNAASATAKRLNLFFYNFARLDRLNVSSLGGDRRGSHFRGLGLCLFPEISFDVSGKLWRSLIRIVMLVWFEWNSFEDEFLNSTRYCEIIIKAGCKHSLLLERMKIFSIV